MLAAGWRRSPHETREPGAVMDHIPPDISRLSEHVIALRISSDDKPYLGVHTIDQLRATLAYVGQNLSVRAVVLEGGPRHFSAGASRESLTASDARANITAYVGEIPRLLLAMPVPLVAAMAGHAIGGGLVLGLWCDAVILAEESLYGANFMALGFTPGMGSTVVVEESFGPHYGREMLYSGRLRKGRELREAGVPLSHAVMPRAGVAARALEISSDWAAAPRGALALLKRRLSGKRLAQLEVALTEEGDMHRELFAQEDTRLAIGERYALGAVPRGAA